MKVIETVSYPVILVENSIDHLDIAKRWRVSDAAPPLKYPAFALCEFRISIDYLYPSDVEAMMNEVS